MKPSLRHVPEAMNVSLLFSLGLLVLGALLAPRPAAAANYPVKLGINTAGDWHMMHTDKLCFQSDAFFKAVKEFNPNFIDVLFMARHAITPTTMTETRMIAQLKELDAAMTTHGLSYTLNMEVANYSLSMEPRPGWNIFDHADGTHRFDVPMSWLNEVLPPRRPGTPRLLAINQDEGEHFQLMGGYFVGGASYDRPYYLNVDGVGLATAFDNLVQRAAWLRNTQYEGRVPVMSEQVQPDMFHIFARAGWTLAPKVLQEEIAPVMLSVALGAALQYQAQPGTDLWVLCEISRALRFPGWAPQALRSALMMGYWIGASGLYVENLDFCDSPWPPHPQATQRPGALLYWDTPTSYGLTKHGQVVKDFFRNYVPAHPRPINWRDYRPRVAIIRLPDGCTGNPTFMPRDRMLGQRNHPATDANAEWLKIWPILTHGYCLPQACSMWHMNIYTDYLDRPFFVPIDSVAVFDHTVHGSVLDSVRCFIVCGEELSQATFDELKARTVKWGAPVIIARRLYDKYAAGPLPGNWLIVDDFYDPAIERTLRPFLGEPDVARYRFKDYTVEFRPTVDTETLAVTVKPAQNAADREWLKQE